MTLEEIRAVIDDMTAEARHSQQVSIAAYGQHGIWDFYYDGRATGLEDAATRLAEAAADARSRQSARCWRVVADRELAVLG